MTVIIFLLILTLLIFVHELGHFVTAKLFKIRVDEFAIGFPPKAFSVTKGETKYALNLIPFGGYVKIFGENPDEESIEGPDKDRSFVHKPKWVQTIVLAAGVCMNVVLAWILISVSLMSGVAVSEHDYPGRELQDVQIMITTVVPNSPAHEAGVKGGDVITSIASGDDVLRGASIEEYQAFIEPRANEELSLSLMRGGEAVETTVTPTVGIIERGAAIGIGMDNIGTLKLSFFEALWHGVKLTGTLLERVTVGLYQFITQAFTGQADFSQVTGPVGIAGLVGDARELGYTYLLTFTALISLHLAVINLVPFPALDGGRILFVAIEAVVRRPIPPKFANITNAIGFALLILLMVVVTWNDIVRLF